MKMKNDKYEYEDDTLSIIFYTQNSEFMVPHKSLYRL
jgi:hypothetical protein